MPLLVVAAIIRRSEHILITRRPLDSGHGGGLWEFPGGKLQADESPEQALRREIHEELALPIRVGEIFESTYHRYDWGPVLILSYECTPLAATVRNIEVADHRWVRPGELPGFELLPADAPIVEKLLRRDESRTFV